MKDDTTKYVAAEIKAEMGMVKTQAQIILPATPQRTADNLLLAPTPTMAPVIVWVVLTGMPPMEAPMMAQAAAASALNPPMG